MSVEFITEEQKLGIFWPQNADLFHIRVRACYLDDANTRRDSFDKCGSQKKEKIKRKIATNIHTIPH